MEQQFDVSDAALHERDEPVPQRGDRTWQPVMVGVGEDSELAMVVVEPGAVAHLERDDGAVPQQDAVGGTKPTPIRGVPRSTPRCAGCE